MDEGDLALVSASRERRKISVAEPLGLAEEEEGGRVVGRKERGRRFRIEGGRARTGNEEERRRRNVSSNETPSRPKTTKSESVTHPASPSLLLINPIALRPATR